MNTDQRYRNTDPVTSALAADKSQRGLSKLRLAVLEVFSIKGSGGWIEMTGSAVNEMYRVMRPGYGLPQCHPDSPRKRAGELAEDGYLDVVGTAKGSYGSEESVYRISPEGRAALARAAA